MNNINFFFADADQYRYRDPISLNDLAFGSDHKLLHLPLNIDTEFWHETLDLSRPRAACDIQHTLTIQVKGIFDSKGEIYSHPDSVAIARHSVEDSYLIICNYLNSRKIPTRMWRNDSPIHHDRTLRVDFYGFFLLAEVLRISQREMKRDLEKLMVFPRQNKITMGRRLIASYTSRTSNLQEQFAYLSNWTIEIIGVKYNLQLAFFDLCAIIGNASYARLCEIAGHELKYKENLDSAQKEEMQRIYLELQEEFDNYALGDLEGYDALLKLESKFEEIYKDLGIEEYWKPGKTLRLTIGATVEKIFESCLMKALGINDRKLLHSLTKPASSEVIKQSNDTTKYNAKVDGGRCRNNRPTDCKVESLICDIDISGCYGEGLREQYYPFGRPIQLGLPINSDNNKYMTLGQFLKKCSDELVPGLWCARVSCKEGYLLKYAQDYLVSWFPPKDITKIPTDSDLEEVEWWTEDNIGITKILRHQVNLAIINHDFIQWIDNIASARQRKEMLDNLEVISAIYYPKSCRVNDLGELLEGVQNHRGKNTTTPKGKGRKTKVVKIEQECHAWFALNLGDLLITKLLTERKKHPKKTPFNELFKLITNTVYGDQVSPFFPIGNVVVGNNITARARCMAWLMEKSLHGFQTITDGCAFEVNRVPYAENQRLTSETLIDAYAKGTDNGHFKFKSLDDTEITDISNHQKIAEKCLEKMRSDFPGMDVLHKPTKTWDGHDRIGQFSLEVKNVFNGIATHGSANYVMLLGESFTEAKYRSHSKKNHEILESNLVVKIKDAKPSQDFLESIYKSPESVPRGKVFKRKSIMKIGTFKRGYEQFENSPIFPGCTLERTGLIREFSLATFSFNTFEQFRSWEREWKRLTDTTGQSYEQFYLNDDGTVNYSKMIKEIDRLIRGGKTSYLGTRLSKYLKGELKGLQEHPEWNTLKRAKEAYGIIYGYAIPDDWDESDELD